MFDSALPAAGDARPFELFGMPLLAVRGADGVLRVFHNICLSTAASRSCARRAA
jgi:phenylpropionate dioxygenase-like ring-hydroxylating dioxygenase large terminal subunit